MLAQTSTQQSHATLDGKVMTPMAMQFLTVGFLAASGSNAPDKFQ
jgi:hypothetical protein